MGQTEYAQTPSDEFGFTKNETQTKLTDSKEHVLLVIFALLLVLFLSIGTGCFFAYSAIAAGIVASGIIETYYMSSWLMVAQSCIVLAIVFGVVSHVGRKIASFIWASLMLISLIVVTTELIVLVVLIAKDVVFGLLPFFTAYLAGQWVLSLPFVILACISAVRTLPNKSALESQNATAIVAYYYLFHLLLAMVVIGFFAFGFYAVFATIAVFKQDIGAVYLLTWLLVLQSAVLSIVFMVICITCKFRTALQWITSIRWFSFLCIVVLLTGTEIVIMGILYGVEVLSNILPALIVSYLGLQFITAAPAALFFILHAFQRRLGASSIQNEEYTTPGEPIELA